MAHLLSQAFILLAVPFQAPVVHGVTIASDGTEARPYCSWWNDPCPNYTVEVKNKCAQRLCEASGYDLGAYISDTGDWCTTDATSSPAWQYMEDVDKFTFVNVTADNSTWYETAVTADCGIQVMSDGTRTRPFCSWYNAPCPNYTAAVKQACAQKLCEASWFKNGTYVGDSGDWCTSNVTSEVSWQYMADIDKYDLAPALAQDGQPWFETAIIAICEP